MAKGNKPTGRASWTEIDDRGASSVVGQRGFYRPTPEDKRLHCAGYEDKIEKLRCEVIIPASRLQKRLPIPGAPGSATLADLIRVIAPGGEFTIEAPPSSGNQPGTWNTIQSADVA